MIELSGDLDEQLRAGQAELDAYDEAHGIEVPVAPGTVPRRGKHAQELPQPPRRALDEVDLLRAMRLEHLAEAERLTAELEAHAVRLYVEHGVQATEIARRTGLSRKWVYAALARVGVRVAS